MTLETTLLTISSGFGAAGAIGFAGGVSVVIARRAVTVREPVVESAADTFAMVSAATSSAGRAVIDAAGVDLAAVADGADAASVAVAGVEGGLVSWFDCEPPD
jgi:hypothetical protein